MLVSKTAGGEVKAMSRQSRMLFAFVLNFLLPGLGFHYSGTRHDLGWLRRLGLVVMVIFLFAFPLVVVIYAPYARINYRFTLPEVVAYLTVAFTLAFAGAGFEQRLSRGKDEEALRT